MKQVLIITSNHRAAITQLRELSKIKDIKIFIGLKTTSLSERIRYHKYLKNNFFIVKNDVKNFLTEVHNKIGEFILFPNGEGFIREVLKEKKYYENLNIELPLPSFEAYRKFSDKYSFQKLCSQYGLNIPKEINPPQNTFTEPFVVKPKILADDKHILRIPMLIENKKAFKKYQKMQLDSEKHFYQQYIKGPSIYYCANYWKGQKRTWCVQRNLAQQPNGKSVIKAEPYNLPKEILAKIDKMFIDNNWNGVMMMELKYSIADKKFYAIECNPRFWGPLQLAIDNNVNFIKALLNPSYTSQPDENAKIGYLWLGGYIKGLLLKIQTKTKFQFFKSEQKKVKYKDVWCRKDTFLYFIYEILYFIFYESIRTLLNIGKNKS